MSAAVQCGSTLPVDQPSLLTVSTSQQLLTRCAGCNTCGQAFKQTNVLVPGAGACGFTPQYSELQSVYSKYSSKGLVVLGFPCNQVGAMCLVAGRARPRGWGHQHFWVLKLGAPGGGGSGSSNRKSPCCVLSKCILISAATCSCLCSFNTRYCAMLLRLCRCSLALRSPAPTLTSSLSHARTTVSPSR